MAHAHGKIILFGEHSVVYGRRAIAASLPIPIETRVEMGDGGAPRLYIPAWELDHRLNDLPPLSQTLDEAVALLLKRVGLEGKSMTIEVTPHLTSGAGLGSSAAICVSILRALSEAFDLKLDDAQVCAHAFEAEKIFHGNPSGLDNTISTYGGMLSFRKGEPPVIEQIATRHAIPLVVALSGHVGDTKKTVSAVRANWQRNPETMEFLFDAVDAIAERAIAAIRTNDLDTLGLLMSHNHGILKTLGVSTRELDLLTDIAQRSGAYGAKLTGGGGGGAVIAVCPPDQSDRIVQAIRGEGFQAFFTTVGAQSPAVVA
jgi:hydroxymethylglutaryl-CoA reductase